MITDKQIEKALFKFANEINEFSNIMENSEDTTFRYNCVRSVSQFDTSNLHFFITIYKKGVYLWYNKKFHICTIQKAVGGWKLNIDDNCKCSRSLLFYFLTSYTKGLLDKMRQDNENIYNTFAEDNLE